jgi:parallel beta-helix repeat protein
MSLWLESASDSSSLEDLSGQLRSGDSLLGFDWKKEFASVCKVGGFSAVLGNPPWLMAAYYKQNDLERLREKFKSAQGKFDLYYLFTELAFDLVSPGGRIGVGSNHILSTNTINGDTNTQAGIMISTYNDPAFKASGNIVDKNTITGGYVGIWTSYNSGNTFTGNIISGTSGNGIYSFESYDNVISNNKIIKTQASTKKGWGITLDQSSPHTQQEGTRTSITNNELISEGTSTLNDGISVYANDSVQLADNTLSSTSVLFAEKITKPAGIVLGTSTEAVRRDLSRGDSGEEVTLVQEALARNGYKIRRTGYFGIATENAVLDFQKNHDLKPTGIVDSTTRSALFNTEN